MWERDRAEGGVGCVCVCVCGGQGSCVAATGICATSRSDRSGGPAGMGGGWCGGGRVGGDVHAWELCGGGKCRGVVRADVL